MTENHGLSAEQYVTLMKPIRDGRISTRSQGGKTLSYVEAWDIKAHLTRIFGFANWDSEIVEYHHVADRVYVNSSGTENIEVIYNCRVQLTIRDQYGNQLCRHSEAAAGSASGGTSTIGDLHDNAIKTAESDALKRCAINLGTQFGLSLYDNGRLTDVIKTTLVKPEGVPEPVTDPEAQKRIEESLGGQEVTQ